MTTNDALVPDLWLPFVSHTSCHFPLYTFSQREKCHLSNLKGNTPSTDGSTHGTIGNDSTGDKKIQSQHGHRVSRMCITVEMHSRSFGVCFIILSL